eukprot:970162-Lingulodinium_polyedra.AAC.1
MLSHLRAVAVPQRSVIRICKMDARRYFHTLAVGRRWRKYLAHPPLGRTAQHGERFPVACSLPMGFAPAASWAQ